MQRSTEFRTQGSSSVNAFRQFSGKEVVAACALLLGIYWGVDYLLSSDYSRGIGFIGVGVVGLATLLWTRLFQRTVPTRAVARRRAAITMVVVATLCFTVAAASRFDGTIESVISIACLITGVLALVAAGALASVARTSRAQRRPQSDR